MSPITLKSWCLIVFAILLILLFGSTTLLSAQTPPPNGNEIVLSGYLGCSIPEAEPRDCPMSLHYVKLHAGRVYAVEMVGAEFAPRLTLEDLFGTVVASDLEYYDDLNGMIVFVPPTTGEYRLTIESPNLIEGAYNVRIREMPVVMNVMSELTPSNPMAHEAFMSVHPMTMTAGRRYMIELRSDEFDTFLKVLNPEGVIVAFADEFGVGRSTRVIFTPTRTATYHLIATSTDPAMIGAFRLIVCEE